MPMGSPEQNISSENSIFPSNIYINDIMEEESNYIPNSTKNLTSLETDQIFAFCVICMSKFIQNSETTVLQCGHSFHNICIGNWFRVASNCPLCRTGITDVEAKATLPAENSEDSEGEPETSFEVINENNTTPNDPSGRPALLLLNSMASRRLGLNNNSVFPFQAVINNTLLQGLAHMRNRQEEMMVEGGEINNLPPPATSSTHTAPINETSNDVEENAVSNANNCSRPWIVLVVVFGTLIIAICIIVATGRVRNNRKINGVNE